MSEILFMVLRRLRAPLITLICVYAISVLGLSLMPGTDPSGAPWQLGFFHAFYVMSYTATTIGFGELPYPFSDAQRAWLIVSIYLSVVGWTYALGSIFAMTTDPTFRATTARAVFRWRVRRLTEPFFIVCGCGQSGTQLALALDQMDFRVVLIDSRPDRAARVANAEFRMPPVVLEADARNPEVLTDAGVIRADCKGVIALTGPDSTNQSIAIGAKVLRNELHVIARVKDPVAHGNLSSFGGVHIVNPFQVLATNLALDMTAPEVLRLEDWFTGAPGTPCPNRVNVPAGPWVLVGYGRFGQTISKVLDDAGVEWHAIDPNEALPREARLLAADNSETALRTAGVGEASVLVAGSDSDTVNLGVTTLARRINPDIFVVIRQNDAADRVLIDAARANLRFVQSELMVRECLQALESPLFGEFIHRIRAGDGAQASRVIDRVMEELGDGAPRNWEFHCDPLQPGLFGALFQAGQTPLEVRHLLADPANREESLAAVAVMLVHKDQTTLLPEPQTTLSSGDRLLFVGRDDARRAHRRLLREPGLVDYVRFGIQRPRSWLFRRIEERRAALAATNHAPAGSAVDPSSS